MGMISHSRHRADMGQKTLTNQPVLYIQIRASNVKCDMNIEMSVGAIFPCKFHTSDIVQRLE